MEHPHLTFNRRQTRAVQLLGHVMHEIETLIPNDQRNLHKQICRRLEDLFFTTGAYIITDADRAAAGLSMRGLDGLTLDELKIIESRMLVAVMQPIMATMPMETDPSDSGCAIAKSAGITWVPRASREPVGWQWRYVGDAEWQTAINGRRIRDDELEHLRGPIEQRPVFAD